MNNFPRLSAGQAAAIAMIMGSAIAPEVAAASQAENPLQQLFAAERFVKEMQNTNGLAMSQPIRRSRVKTTDVAANRLREKRRQKAKQAARRLKASRS